MSVLARYNMSGKVALLSGAGRGIGAASALALAEAGADIAVMARSVDQLENVAAQARAMGRRAIVVPCDANKAEDVSAAVQRTVDELGRIDTVISVVGGSMPQPFMNTSDKDLRNAFENNVINGLRLVRECVPHLLAAGNGVVRKARWFGSYGKYVRIAHGNSYDTAYAHLSRLAPGLREGARVRQGQVIGYVGTTGRSTGPHLHYEVMARSSQINPMDVRLPTGTTLAGADLAVFKAHVSRVNAVLDKWGEQPALVAQGEILRAKLLP